MKIWIDLANSPQVLFFRPMISELERQGHVITITSRHYAQTTELADLYGLTHVPIGGHGGKQLYKIGLRILDRAWQLIRFAQGKGFDLSVSHGSYAQALAARWLRIPFVTLMDYEHQPANHLCFRLATRVIVPECLPDSALRRFGATAQKTIRYPGIKEQAYLADFVPQVNYLSSVGIPADRVIVVVRPPASWTLYHHFENPLFEQVLNHVAGSSEAYVVFLPRVPAQGEAVREHEYANVWVPPRALDGPNLLYHADLVISGGGTMNREAAVLGALTYTLFKGKLGAVDSYLIQQGRMKQIAGESDISTIQLCKSQRHTTLTPKDLVQVISDAIVGVIT